MSTSCRPCRRSRPRSIAKPSESQRRTVGGPATASHARAAPPMDFSLSPEQQAFRDELRTWLRDNVTDEFRTRRGKVADKEWISTRVRWQRRVYEGGYAGISWPKEYGGRGASLIEEMIFNQEIVEARAPEMVNGIGLYMAGPTIIAHGTPEQKSRYLAPLLSGEEIWCQGFSEPNSGSDL